MNPQHPHGLYRWFDAEGKLLYVGISINLAARFIQHKDASCVNSNWYQIARIEIAWYDNRKLAMAAELEAIRTEAPLWNVAGKPSPPVEPLPFPPILTRAQILTDDILRWIRDGEWTPGGQLSSIAKLARADGIIRATTWSKVIRQLVERGILVRRGRRTYVADPLPPGFAPPA